MLQHGSERAIRSLASLLFCILIIPGRSRSTSQRYNDYQAAFSQKI